MLPRWQLDLCFKAELKPTPAWSVKSLEVDIFAVSEPPFGSVVLHELDMHLIRLRQPERGVGVEPRARTPGISEDTYGPQLRRLFSRPGLDNLSEAEVEAVGDKFSEHLSFRVKAREKVPTYYRCTSLGSLYEGQDVVLYLPPDDLSVLTTLTPAGRGLPTEPTLYLSVDEALVLPTLLMLWAGSDELKDAAIALESEGAAAMPKTRVVVASNRDAAAGFPYLKGTLKQVAWASEIREQAAEALRVEIKRRGTKARGKVVSSKVRDYQRMLAWLSPEEVFVLLEEVRFAEDADAWINHRHKPYEWLLTRAEARKKLDFAGSRSSTGD